MPMHFAVDHATQRCRATADGDLHLADLVALFTDLAARHSLDYTLCIDVRRGTLLLSADEIRRLVALTARLRAEHGYARTALIAESDVSFGMARMYATLAAETDTDFMVYRTLREGEAWLGWTLAEAPQPAA